MDVKMGLLAQTELPSFLYKYNIKSISAVRETE